MLYKKNPLGGLDKVTSLWPPWQQVETLSMNISPCLMADACQSHQYNDKWGLGLLKQN